MCGNDLPADRVVFSSFAAFKRTVQQIDLLMLLITLLGLCLFLSYYQRHLWRYNPVHTRI